MLKPRGSIVIEVPYVLDLVRRCEFDTIYHQHVYYFSLTALRSLFQRHGLYIQDMERLEIHGGSVRLHLGREPVAAAGVQAALEEERNAAVWRPEYSRTFVETTHSTGAAASACAYQGVQRPYRRLRRRGQGVYAAQYMRDRVGSVGLHR